jgi:hypothetical protein
MGREVSSGLREPILNHWEERLTILAKAKPVRLREGSSPMTSHFLIVDVAGKVIFSANVFFGLRGATASPK